MWDVTRVEHLVHRRAGGRAAPRDLCAGDRARAGQPLLPLKASRMTESIIVERDGRDRDCRAQPPREAQRADARDVGPARRGDRRAVGRRRRPLHHRPRRRREGVLAGQRHRRVRERALEQGAGDRVRRDDAPHRRSARGCRHPLVAQIHGICVGGGLEIAALCDIRICGDVEPLRRADQEPRAGDGVSRDGAARAARRRCRRARDPARGTHLRRRRGEGERAGHARRARRGCGVGERAPRRNASPKARRSSRAGTRSSRAGSREATPITRAEQDEAFDCFDTEDFRTGYAAFLAKRKPEFRGR